MGRPLKRTESSTIDTAYASGIGGTIGAPSSVTSVYTIDFQYVDAGGSTHAHGFAYKQRGKTRFDVADSTTFASNTTVTLTNAALGALTANTASVICYTTGNVQFYAKRITSHNVWDWNDNKYAYDIQTAATATYANVATY